ncbi:MAG TPA: hypothetical protein VFU76_11660 [Terriglobales bacterium]|nr:hypothetical protein [Terriglobales bacterium]
MSNAVSNVHQEFWTPPQEAQAAAFAGQVHAEACQRCGSEFVMGSRFCHVCGEEREPLVGAPESALANWLDFSRIRESLGLTTGALIAFIAGLACVVAAIATGIIFSAATLLDWQAVQIWRIEWLLAAVAAFLIGLMLKSCK